MKARFYKFSKRTNSTKQPAVADTYLELEVYLKDNTSITDPVMLISYDVHEYNYVYIPSFNRYYFISDIVSTESLWEVAATLDALASYKTEIGATNAIVIYAKDSTKNLVDSRIPVLNEVEKDESYSSFHRVGSTSTVVILDETGSGMAIVGVTGKGSFGAYLLQNSSLVPELLDGIDTWSSAITDTFDFVKQLFYGGSAAENLKSALLIPILLSAVDVSSKSAEGLTLGNYPCKDSNGNDIMAYQIDKPVFRFLSEIDIPWIYTDWRRNSQYTSLSLFLPLIGMLNLPVTDLLTDNKLQIEYAVNVTSGDISAKVSGYTSGVVITTASGNCAMPTAYGSTGINTGKITTAAATGVGAIATAVTAAATGGLSLAVGAAAGAALAHAAGSTVEALGGSGAGSAGLGGGSSHALGAVPRLFITQKKLVTAQSNYNNIIGKPYYAASNISSFSGYVQTDGFKFESNRAFSKEIDLINRLLDTGIYYE